MDELDISDENYVIRIRLWQDLSDHGLIYASQTPICARRYWIFYRCYNYQLLNDETSFSGPSLLSNDSGNDSTIWSRRLLSVKVNLINNELRPARDFNKEIRYSMNLFHRFIPRIIKVFFRNPFLYCIYEECPIYNMKDFLRTANSSRHSADFQRRRIWLAQITSALDFLHSSNLAHLDVRTENIYLFRGDDSYFGTSRYGQYREMVAKLTGFHFVHKHEPITTQIRGPNGLPGQLQELYFDQVAGGELWFMAPEVLACHPNMNRQPYHPFRADIWSLAVTFYCVWFGEGPFKYDTQIVFPEDIYQQMINHNWKISPRIWPWLTEIEKKAFLSMFEINFNERPGNARQILNGPLFTANDAVDSMFNEIPPYRPIRDLRQRRVFIGQRLIRRRNRQQQQQQVQGLPQ